MTHIALDVIDKVISGYLIHNISNEEVCSRMSLNGYHIMKFKTNLSNEDIVFLNEILLHVIPTYSDHKVAYMNCIEQYFFDNIQYEDQTFH